MELPCIAIVEKVASDVKKVVFIPSVKIDCESPVIQNVSGLLPDEDTRFRYIST